MKPLLKKIVICAVVGCVQCGLFAAVLEASPRNDFQQEERCEHDGDRGPGPEGGPHEPGGWHHHHHHHEHDAD